MKSNNLNTIAENHIENRHAVLLLSSVGPLIIIIIIVILIFFECLRSMCCSEQLAYVPGWVLQKQMVKWSLGCRCLLGINKVKGRRRKQEWAEEEKL